MITHNNYSSGYKSTIFISPHEPCLLNLRVCSLHSRPGGGDAGVPADGLRSDLRPSEAAGARDPGSFPPLHELPTERLPLVPATHHPGALGQDHQLQ